MAAQSENKIPSGSETAGGPFSMTGFGRAKALAGGLQIEVEIKCVNHRFLDISCKLPRSHAQFEQTVREVLSSRISRGRVEVFVTRKKMALSGESLSFDRELFRSLYNTYLQIARDEAGLASMSAEEERHLRQNVLLDILRHSDVISAQDEVEDETLEKECLLKAIKQALDDVCVMRQKEGRFLALDLKTRLEKLVRLRDEILSISQNAPQSLKERLLQRLSKLAPEIKLDEGRLAQEVAILSDKVDTTEEITRLRSHLENFQQLLQPSNAQVVASGRKLDFLVQEIGREFNTIGSKAQDAAVQALVIDSKQELEKIREQVQNIE